MKRKISTLLAATVMGGAMMAGPVFAQDTGPLVHSDETDGGPTRINLASRLRMLSQMVPAAACQEKAGYDVEYAHGILESATQEFDTIIDALEFGNPEIGVPTAEERPLTLAEIEAVRVAWKPLHDLADETMAGEVSDEHMSLAMEESMVLLDAAKALVDDMVTEYTNPADMLHAESFVIDMAGRQRMLIQMISKDACLYMNGFDDEAREQMLTTMETHAATLDALRNGMESVGIRRPPTQEIAEALAQVSDEWDSLQPFLTNVSEGNPVEDGDAAASFRLLNQMMEEMSAVVDMYTAAVH